MTKILFINTNCSWNKGSAAQVIGASKILRRFIPNSDFALVSYCPELDSERCGAHNIKVVGSSAKNIRKYPRYPVIIKILIIVYNLSYSLFLCVLAVLWSAVSKIGLNVNKLIDERVLKEYVCSDLIIDLSGDSFSDRKGGVSPQNAFRILLGILLKKPIVIYSQSIGPFKKLTIPLARFCLNKAKLITVREDITKNYLKYIGVNNPPIHITADVGFVLESVPRERVREILLKEGISENSYPLIGISVSARIDRIFKHKKNNRYKKLMAKLVDYLTMKLGAQVVFIPHEEVPVEWGYDDRFVANEIFQLVKNKRKIKLIEGEYKSEELKGIIGQCDLFIGARMHANIAAISTCVPTIAIAWSHKYLGIMRIFGLERYVSNFETMTFEELISKIDDAWLNREEIRKNLIYKVEIEKESAFLSGKLVKDLLNSSSFQDKYLNKAYNSIEYFETDGKICK